MVTDVLQEHSDSQENIQIEMHAGHQKKTMYLARLGVKTVFDVAKLGIIAALEDMKDFTEMASFECETEVRYPRCFRHGRVEAPALWMHFGCIWRKMLWDVRREEERGERGCGFGARETECVCYAAYRGLMFGL